MPPSRIALRDDYDAVALRRLAKGSRNSRQARRLLSLAAVYDGMSRETAAAVGGMDRQTLRDWVHRFNAEGPAGLLDRPRPGMPRRLSEAQMRELAEIVETGPDMDRTAAWRMVRRRAKNADILEEIGNHTFRATGITAYLNAGGALEHAQGMAAHSDPKTAKLYDRTSDEVSLDEVERIFI